MPISLIGTNGLVASGADKVRDDSLVVTFTQPTVVGDRLFLAVSADNLTASTPTVLLVSDLRLNTWDAVAGGAPNASSASAAASVVLRVLHCTVTVAHLVGDTITITLSGVSTSTAGVVLGVRGATSAAPAGVVSSFGTTGGPTLSVSPAAAGNIVVGFIAVENAVGADGDADTLNGSWSTIAAAATTGGNAATNVAASTQAKIVTATGAQTWNPSAGTDWAAVAFTVPAAAVTVVPAVQASWAALEAPVVAPPSAVQVSWAALEAPVAAEVAPVVPVDSLIKHWDGAAWVAKPLKRWDGTAWVPATMRRWSGSAWIPAPPAAPVPTLRSETNTQFVPATTACVLNTPAGAAASDWLVAYLSIDGSGESFATPSGWTLASSNTSISTGYVFVRQHDGVSSSYTFTKTGSALTVLGAMLAYESCSGYDVAGTANSFTAIPTAPSVTTTVANTRLLMLYGCTTSDNNATQPVGYTSRANPLAGGSTARVADKDTPQAVGATGSAATATGYVSTRSWSAFHLALKP